MLFLFFFRFMPFFATTQRPTETILNLWEATTSSKGAVPAVQELIGVLQAMHRPDCANLVQSQASSLPL